MRLFLKTFSLALVNSFILFTLIISPIPFQNISKAMAEEAVEANCNDGKPKEGEDPNIYKVGCEFNKDLGKSKVKSHYPEGVKGIIEEFLNKSITMR